MPETVTHCPLCQSDQSTLFDERTFREHSVANRVCAYCGLVYQSPRMTAAEADAFYAAEYRQLYQGGESPNTKDLAVQRARAEALVNFTQRHAVNLERVLDIGASSGLLLRAMQNKFGCTVTGVEPGNAYREYAAQSGVRMVAALDDLKGEQFDLISMSHVLEHLPDPVGYLTHLRITFMRPASCLLIEVPNLYCHDSFEVAHLSSFSATTLKQTLEKAGFGIVQLEAHGRPRSDMLSFYLTALARPSQKAFAFKAETNVALKRQLGLFYRKLIARLFPARAWKQL
jgi:2-polyprenyl-3-methyl-5-hydroxy-6-metoxy-1,4-benzoquinol methylase